MKASEMTNEDLAKELMSRVPLDSNRHDDIREAAATVAQEMLNTSMQAVTAERINGWATRLAEVCEQPVTDCNQLNNAAAMREALNAIKDTLDEWRTNGEMMEHWQYSELFGIANAALSAPPRNCDVGTSEEQDARHSKWCRRYGIDGDMEVACAHKDMSCALCALRWAQMPYEKGENDGSK